MTYPIWGGAPEGLDGESIDSAEKHNVLPELSDDSEARDRWELRGKTLGRIINIERNHSYSPPFAVIHCLMALLLKTLTCYAQPLQMEKKMSMVNVRSLGIVGLVRKNTITKSRKNGGVEKYDLTWYIQHIQHQRMVTTGAAVLYERTEGVQ